MLQAPPNMANQMSQTLLWIEPLIVPIYMTTHNCDAESLNV